MISLVIKQWHSIVGVVLLFVWGGCFLLQLERLFLISIIHSREGKKYKKVQRATPLHIFLTVWKVRIRIAFHDDIFFI